MSSPPLPTHDYGIIEHYTADTGFGYLRSEEGPEEEKMASFHISACDVQTPHPRTGERVLFMLNTTSTPPLIVSIRRIAIAGNVLVVPQQKPKQPNQLSMKPAAIRRQEPTTVAERQPADTTIQSFAKLENRVYTLQRDLDDAPDFFQGRTFPRFVYVDLDNVWVSFVNANHLVTRFPSATSTKDLFLDLDGFTRRLATGEEGVCVSRLVAFYFNTPEAIANRLRKISHGSVAWDVRKQETTTDTTMQLELLNAKRPCEAHPKTLVLVTGDGNIAPNGMCFREILDLYLRDGWYVEVHAWLSSLARSYIEFQRQYPSTVIIRPFDDEDILDVVRARNQQNQVVAKPKKEYAEPPANSTNPVLTKPRKEFAEPLGSEYEDKAPGYRLAENNSAVAASVQGMKSIRISRSARHHIDSAIESEPPTKSFSADQLAKVLQQLEGANGSLFLPSALMILEQTGAIGPHSGIGEIDHDTQLVMVTMALQEELDTVVRRELRAENTVE